MQMARVSLIVATIAAGLTPAVALVTSPNLRQPAAAAQEVIEMVPVPVVVVEVVEEPAESAMSLSSKCQNELKEVEGSEEKMMAAQQCELESGLTQKAVDSLLLAKRTDALATVANSFEECVKVSSGCAEEIAPKVVLQMRLSGVAVDETCMKVAQAQTQKLPSDDTVKCQENTTKFMVDGLVKQDLEGALVVAQTGLGKCHKLESPCDFQLAPILVVQILQAAQQQQQGGGAPPGGAPTTITEVLLAGMKQANVTKSQLTHNGTASASLLEVSQRVHIA